MKTGLLWYDGDPERPLEDKITRAAVRFHDKYGHGWPDTCYVHPKELEGTNAGANIAVRVPDGNGRLVIRCLPDPTTLPAHFWIGCKEQEV